MFPNNFLGRPPDPLTACGDSISPRPPGNCHRYSILATPLVCSLQQRGDICATETSFIRYTYLSAVVKLLFLCFNVYVRVVVIEFENAFSTDLQQNGNAGVAELFQALFS